MMGCEGVRVEEVGVGRDQAIGSNPLCLAEGRSGVDADADCGCCRGAICGVSSAFRWFVGCCSA